MMNMVTSLSKEELTIYISKQVLNYFPDGKTPDFAAKTEKVLVNTLIRLWRAFSRIKSRYYRNNQGQVYFNHLHGDHYCSFLYLLSNELYKNGYENEASKVFLLNKTMFGIDVFYGIDLPEVFMFIHPVGTIVGNAHYSDYLVIYQGVTIGSLIEGKYPKFGEKTIIYSNSSVIGDCNFGTNCIVGAKAYVIDKDLQNDQIVLGNYPENRVIVNKKPTIDYYFHLDQ